MYLKPTLNPDEIFNQLVDMNAEQAKIIRQQDDFERIANQEPSLN